MKRINLYFYLLLILFAIALCERSIAQADKTIDSLMHVLKTAKEDTNKVNCLIALGKELPRKKNRSEEARNYFNEAIVLAEKLNFKKGMGLGYHTLGNSYLYRNDTEALKYFLAALEIRKEINDRSGIAASYNNIGIIYLNQGRYYEGLKNMLASVKIMEELGDKHGIGNLYNNIGGVFLTLEDYPEAMKYYLACLKMRQEVGVWWEFGDTYYNIGLTYFRQGNYQDALKYIQASMKIRDENGSKQGVADCYNYLGIIYDYQGNITEALKNYLAALKIRQGDGYKHPIAVSYNTIGDYYRLHSNYTEALDNYFRCLENAEEAKAKYQIADCCNDIGIVYLKLSKYPDAKQYFMKALSVSKEIGNKEEIRNVYWGLSKLDSALGDYGQALIHYELYTGYKDSLLSETYNKQIIQMKEQYESEKKDKDILQLTTDKQKLESEKQISALQLKNKQDSLNIAEVEKQKVELENKNIQALNLYNEKQIELLGNEKKLQQLQIDKDQADYAAQKSETDKKQEQLTVVNKEKAIQQLELQKQKQSKNYFIAGLGLLGILSFFVFRNFQNQRKLNKLYKVSAEKQMAELQLQSLRAQLNPHFMFNSLNAIQELIVMEENEKSQSYLERFSQLLRQLLENSNQPFIPLIKEINFLDLYLSLESLRLPDLKYSIKIDPQINAENFVIPNMMLQPYIENALWHGLQHKQGEKKLQLHVSRQNGSVQYEIKDNGVGRKKAEEMKSLYRKEHRSKGMELLAQRFDLLSQEYGQSISTTVTDLSENGYATGTLVEITVPASLSEQNKNPLYDTNDHHR